MRALLALDARSMRKLDEVLRLCRELGQQSDAAIGISELHAAPRYAARAYREAVDAAKIGAALLASGGAVAYSEVGAYRYLVHIGAEDAPHDRMRAAVDCLIEYDRKRRTALLDTLERTDRAAQRDRKRPRAVHPSQHAAPAPGTDRGATGLQLDQDDLLSLELAIKLARLHGRP